MGSKMVEHADRSTAPLHRPSRWYLGLLLPWVAGLVFMIHTWHTDRAVAGRESTTRGTITTDDPANHNSYQYSYAIRGIQYSAWDIPRADKLDPGRAVLVYYDPLVPSTSSLTDFADSSDRVLVPIVVVMFILPAVAFAILRQLRTGRRAFGCTY